jgi:hypothetical protein
MKKITVCAACLALLFLTSLSFSEMKTFIREYSYDAAEMDSKISCRSIALEQVKRLLLEELGTYVESVTVVKDYQVDREQISVLTAGVVQTTILDEKWDGKKYWLKAQISADPDEVAAAVNQLKDNQQLVADLKESRDEARNALAEVESLKAALADATSAKESKAQYDDSIRQLQATDQFERGQSYATAGDYQQSITAYDQAALLRPGDSKVYSNRGTSFVLLGNYQQAFIDFNRAIRLNPQKTTLYEQRNVAIKMLRAPDRMTPAEKRYFENRQIKRTSQIRQEQDRRQKPPQQIRSIEDRDRYKMLQRREQERLKREEQQIRQTMDRQKRDQQRRQTVDRQQRDQQHRQTVDRQQRDQQRRQTVDRQQRDQQRRQTVDRQQRDQRIEANKIRQQKEKDKQPQKKHREEIISTETKAKDDKHIGTAKERTGIDRRPDRK